MEDLRHCLGDEDIRLIEASISDEQLQQLFASMIALAVELRKNYLLVPWTPVGRREMAYEDFCAKVRGDIQSLRVKFNHRAEELLTAPELT